MKAIDEVCELLVKKFEKEYRNIASGDYVELHKTSWAEEFRTVDIHRVGFRSLLNKLKEKGSLSERAILEMAWRGEICEEIPLIANYLYRYSGILLEKKDDEYSLTKLAIRLMKELGWSNN